MHRKLLPALVLAAPAAAFTHTECFDALGQPSGASVVGDVTAAMVEGFALGEDTQLDVGLQAPLHYSPGLAIPETCFVADEDSGALVLPSGGAGAGHYNLGGCLADRTYEEILLTCLAVCAASSGCEAVMVHKVTAKGECRLHGGFNDNGKCAEYPQRFACSYRDADHEAVGFLCPAQPLDPRKYLPAGTAALATPIEAATGNRRLIIAVELSAACTETATEMAAATLANLPSAANASVSCPTSDTRPAEISFLTVEVATPASYALHDILRGSACVDLDACASLDESTFGKTLASQLNLALRSFSQSSWDVEGYHDAVFLDSPSCTADGSSVGVSITPLVSASLFGVGDGAQFAPENHQAPPVFYKSMLDPERDVYAVPDGCFPDTEELGTPSNPAMIRAGAHLELMGSECVGNRTQLEMLLICLTICAHIDFGEPGDADTRCIGVNYDEHGDGGHCHLQSSAKVTSYRSNGCVEYDAEALNLGGMCAEPPALTTRAQCSEGALLDGMDNCGRVNFMGVFCHFSSGGTGPSAGRRCELGFGFDEATQSCGFCEAGTYSLPRLDGGIERELAGGAAFPRPLDMPMTINTCEVCPPGRSCVRGSGCAYGVDAAMCPDVCPLGHRCPEGAEAPSACAAAEYQDEEGQDACKACPTGHGLAVGATSLQNCVCRDGFYRASAQSVDDPAAAAPCIPCVEGMDCEWLGVGYAVAVDVRTSATALINARSRNQTTPRVLPGYWASVAEPTVLLVCDARLHPHPDCVGGEVGGAYSLCANGREGTLCARCEDGSVVAADGGCIGCDAGTDAGLLTAFVAGLVALLYALHRGANRAAATERLAHLASVAAVTQIFDFLQALCAIASIQVRWGPPFSTLLRGLSALMFDLDVLHFSCVISDGAVSGLLAKRRVATAASAVAQPLFSQLSRWYPLAVGCPPYPGGATEPLGVVSLRAPASEAVPRRGASRAPTPQAKLLTPLFLVALFGLVFAVDRALRPGARAEQTAVAWCNTTGLVWYTFYTSMCLVAFQPFVCFEQADTGTMSLSLDPDVTCWESAEHRTMVGLAVVAILVYPLGSLLAAAHLARQYDSVLLRSSTSMKKFKFLFGRWRIECAHYAVLRLLRLLAIAAIPTLLPFDAPEVQVSMLTTVLALSGLYQVAVWPWRVDALNVLDAGLTLALLLILSIMGTAVAAPEGVSDAQSAFATALVCLCGAGMAGYVCAKLRRSFGEAAICYQFFLSHHKGGAGHTARLMKVLLSKATKQWPDVSSHRLLGL